MTWKVVCCLQDEMVKALHLWNILAFLLKLPLGEDPAYVFPLCENRKEARNVWPQCQPCC